jgi:hypothetical protein
VLARVRLTLIALLRCAATYGVQRRCHSLHAIRPPSVDSLQHALPWCARCAAGLFCLSCLLPHSAGRTRLPPVECIAPKTRAAACAVSAHLTYAAPLVCAAPPSYAASCSLAAPARTTTAASTPSHARIARGPLPQPTAARSRTAQRWPRGSGGTARSSPHGSRCGDGAARRRGVRRRASAVPQPTRSSRRSCCTCAGAYASWHLRNRSIQQ